MNGGRWIIYGVYHTLLADVTVDPTDDLQVAEMVDLMAAYSVAWKAEIWAASMVASMAVQ